MHFQKKVFIGLLSLLFVFSAFTVQQAAYANGWKPLVETGWLVLHLGDKDTIPVYVGFIEDKPGDDKAKFEASSHPRVRISWYE